MTLATEAKAEPMLGVDLSAFARASMNMSSCFSISSTRCLRICNRQRPTRLALRLHGGVHGQRPASLAILPELAAGTTVCRPALGSGP